MSTWAEGRTYDYYGTPLTCVRRYFIGSLEVVELQQPARATTDGSIVQPEPFARAARTLAPCVVPRVTETLGGVLRPDACDHRYSERITADAGPHAGAVCCGSCGAPVAELGTSLEQPKKGGR